MMSNIPAVSVRLLLILILGCLLSGCKKDDSLSISGTVIDPDLSTPVADVTVELWVQKIEDGYYYANYILDQTTTSGPDGKFGFKIDSKNYTGIRLIIKKEGYYDGTANLDIQQLKNDGSSKANYHLVTKAWLQIQVKNIQPFDSNDFFEFTIKYGYTSCTECCREYTYSFQGDLVDSTIDCQTSGNHYIEINWAVLKNDKKIYKSHSYFVKPFVVNSIDLYY